MPQQSPKPAKQDAAHAHARVWCERRPAHPQASPAVRPERVPDIKLFVSIAALIAMKQAAGQPRDLDDIEHLRLLQKEFSKE